ncbi:MAG TPA: Fe-S cluster assembly protein SufD [Acidimicrobiia bacterium]|jgi:Fe-S cluster assembly protein SufD|nr:FeS assembly protein SufD [Acidimicrobiia bacterium]HYJ24034.1 Fe-S cluster assembly protein SufD [Acidimicrobiia bacterium]
MEAAYQVFTSLEEPTGAEEDWRYVELDHTFSELQPVAVPGTELEPGRFVASLPERSGRVLIVDGHVLEHDSAVAGVQRFSDLDDDPGFTGMVPTDHNKLAAAHAAFSTEGARVEVKPNAVMEAPLVVEIQATTAGTVSFPHLQVVVGENAEASVLVDYRSADGARLLLVPRVDLELGNGGRLRFLSVQGLDHAATNVVHQRAVLSRDSTSRIGEIGLGAKLGRLDLGVSLVGDGSSSEVVGLYFGEGDQTLDYRMVIDHQGRSTTSDVFLKGAVEDDAQSVFTGLLRIEKDAARTSTFETNRNLVLSENAKAHSVPNLEILCNDVICGHASSVGPLESDHLYYLMSRGLNRERAERLLIRGFFQQVIDRLPIEGLGEVVSDEVFRRFVAAQEEGRVA